MKFLLEKRNTFADITKDIGQVLFGAMVIGPIVDKNPVNWILLYVGAFATLFSWFISVIIKKQ